MQRFYSHRRDTLVTLQSVDSWTFRHHRWLCLGEEIWSGRLNCIQRWWLVTKNAKIINKNNCLILLVSQGIQQKCLVYVLYVAKSLWTLLFGLWLFVAFMGNLNVKAWKDHLENMGSQFGCWGQCKFQGSCDDLGSPCQYWDCTTPVFKQPAETLKLDKLIILYQPVSTNWDFNIHLWWKTGWYLGLRGKTEKKGHCACCCKVQVH